MASNDDIVKAINSLRYVPLKKNKIFCSISVPPLVSSELAPQTDIKFLVQKFRKSGFPLPVIDSYGDVSDYDNQDIKQDIYEKSRSYTDNLNYLMRDSSLKEKNDEKKENNDDLNQNANKSQGQA